MTKYGTFSIVDKIKETGKSISDRDIAITCAIIFGALNLYIWWCILIWQPKLPNHTDQLYTEHCVRRKFNHSSYVCVCNTAYCDKAPAINLTENGSYYHITTSRTLRFYTKSGNFTSPSSKKFTFRISRQNTRQKIYGFGGAFTDAAGLNMRSISIPLAEDVLRSYFHPEGGIGYTMGRVPIGSTDFSTHFYSYDEFSNDTELRKFSLQEEDTGLKLHFIKRAENLAGRKLDLIGTAWSAPKWMKTEYSIDKGELKEEYYQSWANYHVKFLDQYERKEIKFWALTTGNRPLSGNRYSGMKWTLDNSSKWIAEYLGPTIASSRHKNVHLLTLDDDLVHLQKLSKEVLHNETVAKYIQGIAIQGYSNEKESDKILSTVHEKYPSKFLLRTESSVGASQRKTVELGSWSKAQYYIENMIEGLNNYIAGWIDWNLALDLHGGPNYANNTADAPIIVNSTSNEFYKQPIFYAIGHFSKFIPPGSFRIQVTSQDPDILVTAFERPDNGITVIFYNRKLVPVNVTFVDEIRGEVTAAVPKESINTIVYS